MIEIKVKGQEAAVKAEGPFGDVVIEIVTGLLAFMRSLPNDNSRESFRLSLLEAFSRRCCFGDETWPTGGDDNA